MSSTAWSYFEGDWREGPAQLMSATTHSAWLAHTVFDGARRYDGVFPDLELHCERVIRSARIMGMTPEITPEEIEGLARDGASRFDGNETLYIRPMFWIEEGFGPIDPGTTRFALVIQAMPMPDVEPGFSAQISDFRKPSPETAPTGAKASCLYPQATLAWTAARKAGFNNAVMLDAIGNVAEFTMQNIFIVKDGAVHTPVANGMLLPGITRRRVMLLLKDMGIETIERTIGPAELMQAEEIISSGNHARVYPCNRIGQRDIGVGRIGRRLVTAYRDFAHSKN